MAVRIGDQGFRPAFARECGLALAKREGTLGWVQQKTTGKKPACDRHLPASGGFESTR